MCEVFDEIRREGEERGIRLGEERGIRLGEERMLLANIRAVMKNMSLTAEEAFDLFDVPNEKRQKYLTML